MTKMKYKHIFTYWIRIQLCWENENRMTLVIFEFKLENVLDSRCFKQIWELINNLRKKAPYLFTTNLFSSLNKATVLIIIMKNAFSLVTWTDTESNLEDVAYMINFVNLSQVSAQWLILEFLYPMQEFRTQP